ncbi:hypothetical protein [Streptomyces albus]|uniref:hypothetical protein n=1 Tax=Streptomyces albus TaxID=1888 RepID=UPI001570D910|nr:hypothetical protein [Streptomyces albus]
MPLGLALAVVPAVWATRVFARAARRRLEGSRSLEEFAAGTRPLLALAVTGFAATLPALHWAARAVTDALAPSGTPLAEEPSRPASWAAAALALLLFAALLPGAHGFGRAARTGLATACALEAAALLTVPAARLPGLGAVARPVEVLAAHHGVAAVPLAACACAALGLLAYAAVALTGATAHHREEESV